MSKYRGKNMPPAHKKKERKTNKISDDDTNPQNQTLLFVEVLGKKTKITISIFKLQSL